MAEVKPVRAWACVFQNGQIHAGRVREDRDAVASEYPSRIERVVILRESDYRKLVQPKRRAKKERK